MFLALRLSLCVCPTDGEPADDRHCSVGEVVRSCVQFPSGGRHHWCGRLPLLCGPGWPHRGHEAPPSFALLRILQTVHTVVDITAFIFYLHHVQYMIAIHKKGSVLIKEIHNLIH